ncbi:MAG TPA: dihydrofolate reductase family protein [Candidatus Dojkabacteria bacterium]|nr:dihydrofolate reductase family protein [Candidatus Dojkabacteria bacterium]HRP51016.1 dihydrofolate reductase family protein [Candidatus Dojkabacteria bacterium]
MNRTFNTLFLLISVDGKISTGSVPDRDVDKDYKNLPGIKEGLHQYYEIEKTTDNFSLNSGFVMSKIGVNTDQNPIHCPGVNFIIIDNKNLNTQGIRNLCDNVKTLFLVTTNENHPAFKLENDNLEIIFYESEVDFKDLFARLRNDYKAERVTIQSGGTLNSVFLRKGLIDRVSIVVAPCLIGGKDTSSLIDGDSLISEADLKNIKSLTLESVKQLRDNYLHIIYNVNN